MEIESIWNGVEFDSDFYDGLSWKFLITKSGLLSWVNPHKVEYFSLLFHEQTAFLIQKENFLPQHQHKNKEKKTKKIVENSLNEIFPPKINFNFTCWFF